MKVISEERKEKLRKVYKYYIVDIHKFETEFIKLTKFEKKLVLITFLGDNDYDNTSPESFKYFLDNHNDILNDINNDYRNDSEEVDVDDDVDIDDVIIIDENGEKYGYFSSRLYDHIK